MYLLISWIYMYICYLLSFQATVLYLVPPIIVAMVRHPLSFSTDLKSVKHAICAAAPLRKEQTDAFKNILPETDIKQGDSPHIFTLHIHVHMLHFCKTPYNVCDTMCNYN